MNFNYEKLSEIKNIKNCIYKITNTINNKVYVGKTQATLISRIRRHCREVRNGINRNIYNAIRKYNWDNFSVQVIEICSSLIELNEREIYWISVLKSNNKEFGYNMTEGGDGCGFSAEALKKSADKRRGKPIPDSVKKKISDGNKGKVVIISDETKNKISATLTGRMPEKPIHKNMEGKIPGMLGKKHSEEAKKQMSLHQTGLSRWTEDQKKQMSIDRCREGNPFWKSLEKDNLELLIKNGKSINEIANFYTVSIPTVLSRIKLYFGFTGISDAYFEWVTKPKLITSISNGLSAVQIANSIGCHKSGLLLKIKKIGFSSLKEARQSLLNGV